jgi:uncharacterized delta-60 repeat protein
MVRFCWIALLLAKFTVSAQVAGSFDPSFSPISISQTRVLKCQTDGTILVGGTFLQINGITNKYVARLLNGGTVDPTFNPGTNLNKYVNGMGIQSNGQIVLGGEFTAYGTNARGRIVRLNHDGSLDASFSPSANNIVYCLVVLPDDKVVIGGRFTTISGTSRPHIARLNADGSLDTGFNPGTGANGDVNGVTVQSDGKIIACGLFNLMNGTNSSRVARLNLDGSVDATFNPGAGASSTLFQTAVQADGKIIVVGSYGYFDTNFVSNIARLNSDGSFDHTFLTGAGTDGDITAVCIQSNQRIIVGGRFTSFNQTITQSVVRLNTDGSVDTGFVNPLSCQNYIWLTAAPNDDVLVGGAFNSNAVPGFAVVRLVGFRRPELTIDGIDPSGALVTLITETNRNYRIQASADFNVWSDLTNYFGATGTTNFSFLDSANLGRRFFRAVTP